MAEEESEVVAPAAEGGVGESKEEAPAVLKPVSRPDKSEFEAKSAVIQEAMMELKGKIDGIDAKINEAKSSVDQSSELKEAKETLKALRERRDALNKEKTAIFAQQESARESLKSKMAQTKSMRSELKFETPEKYDERIAQLEKKQSTTSMSLKEEKNLLKEIEQLKSSKKLVTALAATNSEIAADKVSSASIGDSLKAKIAELDEVRKECDKQKKVVDSLNEVNSSRRAVLPSLYAKKDELRDAKTAKFEEMKAIKAEFRSKEKEYQEYKKELYRQKQEQRKKEEEARQAQIEERKRKAEEEELKRIPYEEEMRLCDYLVSFLENKYGAGAARSSGVDENSTPPAATEQGGEFEGMVLGGKKSKQEEDYLSLNATFGKKKGRGKKKGGQKVVDRISIDPATILIFSDLNLEPPSTVSAVPDSIEKLKEKKEWYSTQERGAVPSIRDKQRAEENKQQNSRGDRRSSSEPAAASEKSSEKAKGESKKSSKKVGFNATEAADELFPSLPGSSAPKKMTSPVEESKEDAAKKDKSKAAPAADDSKTAAEAAATEEKGEKEAATEDGA